MGIASPNKTGRHNTDCRKWLRDWIPRFSQHNQPGPSTRCWEKGIEKSTWPEILNAIFFLDIPFYTFTCVWKTDREGQKRGTYHLTQNKEKKLNCKEKQCLDELNFRTWATFPVTLSSSSRSNNLYTSPILEKPCTIRERNIPKTKRHLHLILDSKDPS